MYESIVNLTPHSINLVIKEKIVKTWERCEKPPRIKELELNGYETIHGCEIITKRMGEVENLPEPKGQQYFIVSLPLAIIMKGKRIDLITPHNYARDEKGRIIGCRKFARTV